MEAYAVETSPVVFAGSRGRFETVAAWLEGAESAALPHAELEARLEVESRELFRQLLQDHLDLRAQRERRLDEVVGADGLPRGCAEAGHERRLATVFGEVQVQRIAYRNRGYGNLHPADGVLNLPTEKHSHGLRRLAAIESARGSFETAVEAVQRATGQRLGKRVVQQLAERAAGDFDAFYAQRPRHLSEVGDVLVLSCDGKGIVMRPEGLRATTRKAAATATQKLTARCPRGRSVNRKRIAEVGAVYDCAPAPRTSGDILAGGDAQPQRAAGPKTRSKWLMASVVEDAAEVVARIFNEADRRDLAATIRGRATRAGLRPDQRKNADTCANYLISKRPYLHYPTALDAGWPISTGVIEGACRHLVNDRMDITGARWGLHGAEAILKLRVLHSNGDFEAYWTYHLAQEQRRTHQARYANGVIPAA